MTLLQAMARMEGFYAQGSRPQRNHNPGDLSWGEEARRFGATHGDPRFAVFPDDAVGWTALQRWLSVPARFDGEGRLVGGYLGASLRQVVARFAPPSENDSDGYLEFMCKSTGLAPNTIVTKDLLRTPEIP